VTYTCKLFTLINCPIYQKNNPLEGGDGLDYPIFFFFFCCPDKPLTQLQEWFSHLLKDIRSDPTTIHNYDDTLAILKSFFRGSWNHTLSPKGGSVAFLGISSVSGFGIVKLYP